jgi:hypothetical protein
MPAASVHAVARLRLLEAGDDRVVVGIPGTQYRLHLAIAAPVATEPGRRIRGVIRARVWKVDFVSSGGGSFIEPVYGRPRRVQGPVVEAAADLNAVVVDVCDCPVLGLLPDRWTASQITPGTRVGLDVYDGAVFEPIA